MHKCEIKVSIKRTNCGNLPFLSGYTLNLVEKKDMASNQLIFDIMVNFERFLNVFKNFPAKSEIKGLTEKTKISYVNLICFESYLCSIFQVLSVF